MSHWTTRLRESLTLIIGGVIFIALLIVGIYVLSYLIIAIAATCIVVFIVSQVRSWFRAPKNGAQQQDQSHHRPIDHDEIND